MDAKEIYYESLLTKMLFQKSSIKKIPLSGTFELSPVCNFDCRMCYVRKSPEEVKCHNRKMLNLEQWKKSKRLNFRHGYKNPRPHFCNRSTLIIHI